LIDREGIDAGMAMISATGLLARRAGIAFAIAVLACALIVLALGALPFGMFKSVFEARIGAHFGVRVHIGSVSRRQMFSYAPDVTINDLRIAQPDWVGGGTFVSAQKVTLRLPVLRLLFGEVRPDALTVEGLNVELVRNANGRANWQGTAGPSRRPHASPALALSRLIIRDGHIGLRDAKRGLYVAGTLSAIGADGVRIGASGSFLGTSARLDFRGGRIDGINPAAAWPIDLHLASPALRLDAVGTTDGVLNTQRLHATVTARAPTLRNLDCIIEAGLFGTKPIALVGEVRHDGRDWYLDRIGGGIGRSRFVGTASILKRDGRTRISAGLRASRFDFDDLSEAQVPADRAASAARVLPPTPINLSHLGRTDGTLAFRIDHLLASGGSVFRSLNGRMSLDHRLLTVDHLVATMASGQMTGVLRVDHRSGRPKLTTDLRLEGVALDRLLGAPDDISGNVRGRIVLAGEGDTIREALAHADGRAAIVSNHGTIKAVVADVLGQDLGGTIKQAIVHPSEREPLRCLIADFRARGGMLTPSPLAIDTGDAIGRGNGRINLANETIALTIAGRTRGDPALRIVDPISVGGTLSHPAIAIAGNGTTSGRPSVGGIFKALGRSIKDALGFGDAAPPRPAFVPLDCERLSAAALR
jgi:uncharacterized protein involved in outer membrane biogenesis